MKINLNLLPKNRKKKIENGKILKLFVWQEGMLIFTMVMLIGIVIGVREIIDIRMESVESQATSDSAEGSYAEIKKYEEALNKTKSDIIVIDKVQRNNINWVPVFQEINSSMVDGVIATSMSNEEYRVTISGIAENRDQLIEMKKGVEENSCFKEVSIPINDIVLKNNIDFKVSFDVNRECLIKYEEE